MRYLRVIGLLLMFISVQRCTVKKGTMSDEALHLNRIHDSRFCLLTYNVLTGFQKDAGQAERFIEWIKPRHFDMVAFQELSGFTQDSLERFARRYGHNYAVLNKGNGSPIGITSKYPLLHVKKIADAMHHGCIYAEVSGFHVFVTHLSPFSYEKCLEEMSGILAMAARLPSREKILILGDLNSFSPADSSGYAQKRRYGVIQKLIDSGYTDSYRRVHDRFESSFPTTAYIRKVKAPTRIDYVFANKTAASYIDGAEIIKDSVTSVLSDHYPLLITFKQRN